jgi:DNA modification methylase
MSGSYRILLGDNRETLREIPDGTVQTVVTSPPYYGLRDYGHDGQIGLEETPEAYVSALVDVFREVRRVLRDDGTVWLNLGDSYNGGGTSTQIVDSSIRESTRSEALTGGKIPPQGAAPRVKSLKPKDLIGIPWRVAFALQADGWYLRQDIIWHKPNPMPESVTDRCTKAHEYIFLLTKSARYYYDAEAVKESTSREYKDGEDFGGFAKKDRLKSVVANQSHAPSMINANLPTSRNRRSVWTISARPYKHAHFATFPKKLIEPCILAGCPKEVCAECGAPWVRVVERTKIKDSDSKRYNGVSMRNDAGDGRSHHETKTLGFQPTCTCNAGTIPGTVLDPFNGSGTTGAVALQFNRDYIGIELNPEYLELTKRRLWSVQPEMF